MAHSFAILVIAACIFASAAAIALWVSARGQARRESRQILKALQSSDALLSEEIEPLLDQGQAMLAHASTARTGTGLLDAVSAFRARVATARMRVLSLTQAERALLTEAGVDLRVALDALGRASTAVQDLYALVSHVRDGEATELLHASARCASARVSELGQEVHRVQSSIHRKEAALERLAA